VNLRSSGPGQEWALSRPGWNGSDRPTRQCTRPDGVATRKSRPAPSAPGCFASVTHQLRNRVLPHRGCQLISCKSRERRAKTPGPPPGCGSHSSGESGVGQAGASFRNDWTFRCHHVSCPCSRPGGPIETQGKRLRNSRQADLPGSASLRTRLLRRNSVFHHLLSD